MKYGLERADLLSVYRVFFHFRVLTVDKIIMAIRSEFALRLT